jgi:hypothetical protein
MSRSQRCTLHKFCLLFDTKPLCKQLRMLYRRQVLRESRKRCKFQSHLHYRFCSLWYNLCMCCLKRGTEYSSKMLHKFCLRGGQSQSRKRCRLHPVMSKFYILCHNSHMPSPHFGIDCWSNSEDKFCRKQDRNQLRKQYRHQSGLYTLYILWRRLSKCSYR